MKWKIPVLSRWGYEREVLSPAILRRTCGLQVETLPNNARFNFYQTKSYIYNNTSTIVSLENG